MVKQKTIKNEIAYSGVGLHTGNNTTVVFKPAKENSGIRFIRTDIPGAPVLNASIDNVIGVTRGTTLGTDHTKIHTVEHIMASLCALGIDNLIIEVDSSEPPIGDGSALPFIETLKKAGIVELSDEKKYIEITQPVEYAHEDVYLLLMPADDFRISCTIDYNHPVLGTQFISFVMDEKRFIKEIAPSRTFCFDYEIETLKREGLAKGGSLDNAVVIGEKKIHNKNLRFDDEFVRHKVMDLIGDVYLVGGPIKGHILAARCGHAANIAFAKKIRESLRTKQKAKPVKQEEIEQTSHGRWMDINEIKATIPHRYPFLFVDKVVIIEEQKKAIGFKNVTGNDSFFQGHFPEKPIMPGVLIVEAMAQTSCVLFLSRPDLKHKLAFFMGINDVKFRRPVVPGDILRMEVEVIRAREKGGKVFGKAYVEDKLAVQAEII
ncbi:UDP-3-O-acyl-N-acetylglucosamine deacetylase, partial [bacterium]